MKDFEQKSNVGTLEEYLDSTVDNHDREAAAKRRSRRSCYIKGQRIVRHLEHHWGPLAQTRVLDVASAWGEHSQEAVPKAAFWHSLLALAEGGAEVIYDHNLAQLSQFAGSRGLSLNGLRADCQKLPFRRHSFDGIIALELIEHIPKVEKFAAEAVRVLKPGGFLLVSTPPRWRSFFWGEPHYQLRYLTILPFPLQEKVARGVLKRDYPYPIERQFTTAAAVARAFVVSGFEMTIITEGRMGNLSDKLPQIGSFVSERFFTYLLFRAPRTEKDALSERATTSSTV